jgi:hypothetical protein
MGTEATGTEGIGIEGFIGPEECVCSLVPGS